MIHPNMATMPVFFEHRYRQNFNLLFIDDDTAAAYPAGALQAERLIMLTDFGAGTMVMGGWMNMDDIKTIDQTYVANTYNRFDAAIVSGHGSDVYDANGKRYIDMDSGIGITCFSIGDPLWKEAVMDQLGKIQHLSNRY